MHEDPIAFFLTITTYGVWLPGDQRGWVEFRQGWQLPDPIRKLEAEAKMSEDSCLLGWHERKIVENQVAETCQHRGWTLYAVNCRSNHMHLVVAADGVHPKRIRQDIKAWATRKLRELSDASRLNWWAERGSIRWIFDEAGLATVVAYVTEAQDRKHLDS